MSMPHPSQIDWQEIEKKMNELKTTPTHSNGEEWREGYTKIEHPEWGTVGLKGQRQSIHCVNGTQRDLIHTI
jgi:hypothetical protein